MRIYLSIAATFMMPFVLLATEKPVKVLLIDGFSNHNWQLKCGGTDIDGPGTLLVGDKKR